jgi:hypothetical protein
MTTPIQPARPTVLKFRSKSGRTEFALMPDGTVKVHVLHGSDTLNRADIATAARALNEAAQDG